MRIPPKKYVELVEENRRNNMINALRVVDPEAATQLGKSSVDTCYIQDYINSHNFNVNKDQKEPFAIKRDLEVPAT